MSYPLVKAVVSQFFGDNPTNGLPSSHWIIKQFGNYQPFGHTGVDFECAIGTPILAVAPGRVLHVGIMGGTYADNPWWIAPAFAGYCYVIDHYPSDGSPSFIGIYGHGKDKGATVSKGDWVTEGQVIGLTGNTGGSTGPHLHFEVLPNGYNLNTKMYGRVDPTPYLNNIGPLGSITQENELSAAEVAEIKAHVTETVKNIAASGVAGQRSAGPLYDTAERVKSIEATLLPGEAGVRNAGAVYSLLAALKGSSGAAPTVDNAGLAVAFVEAIPDELAQDIVDALIARLALAGGK